MVDVCLADLARGRTVSTPGLLYSAVFHTLDRDELELPFDGLTLFEGLEDGRELLVNPAAVRRQYQEELAGFLARTESDCLGAGIDYRRCDTRTPVERVLLDFLLQRSRTARGGARATR